MLTFVNESKQFVLDEEITLTVSKRASSRRIRLSISGNGQVKASIPRWVPYGAAIDFAKTKLPWIKSKMPKMQYFQEGRQIGKNHHLTFKATDKDKISTRVSDIEATVFYPRTITILDQGAQDAAKRVIKKALDAQAKRLLPIRLAQLAKKYDYQYESLRVKSLKSRWGSCDSHKNITLNLYLMELPWELIDYVCLHELNHTLVMQHGPKFWDSLSKNLPNCLELRKQLKNYPTLV
jgi:predicted metal-dependent hydrolase